MAFMPRFDPVSGETSTDRALRRKAGSRFLFGILMWWILTEGRVDALPFGAVVAGLAAWLSLRMFPPGRHALRWFEVPRFALFFVGRSITAGVDVAQRLLRPSLPISPGILVVEPMVPEGGPRCLLANTLSLLPGTLSVELYEGRLELHCLDLDMDIAASVRDTEARVAALFGLPVKSTE
jgi:multicomponent Na+:H+ antiporter subunit E